jgi:hypothetical protein
VGETVQGLRAWYLASVPPAGRLWLAAGVACLSAVALGTTTTLVAFARLFGESCGEDWRWVGLVVATALAALAGLAGMVLGGFSLFPSADGRVGRRWTPAILVVTGASWSVAVVSLWLPTGACA